MTGAIPSKPSQGLLVAVAGPVAVAAAAYALWWISDQLLYIGPLDRAAFGWLVVIPVLLAAPIVAGYLWQRLPSGQDAVAGSVVGALIGVGTAFLLWRAVTQIACETRPTHTPADWVVPALVIGGLVGAALAGGGLIASRFLREGRRLAAILGAISVSVLVLAMALLAFAVLFAGPGCERPTPVG